MTTLQTEIEARLAECEPDVEVLLAEVVGGGTLRIFIDHPEGVTLALCERMTVALSPLRERYTLEISSPGIERPLTKPDHFRRFVGRRARVRTRGDQPTEAGGHAPAALADLGMRAERVSPQSVPVSVSGRANQPSSLSRRSYTGELVGASDTEITLAADGTLVSIPYAQIRRSNLVEE